MMTFFGKHLEQSFVYLERTLNFSSLAELAQDLMLDGVNTRRATNSDDRAVYKARVGH